MLAVENIEGYFPVPAEYMPNAQSFMLKVKGDSMINAGIFDGDQVLVRQQSSASNGDIVVALEMCIRDSLCASSISSPSRFNTTVELSTNVSAISRVSSIDVGLITHTSIFAACDPFLLLRIGVILDEVLRTGLSCLTDTFGCLLYTSYGHRCITGQKKRRFLLSALF